MRRLVFLLLAACGPQLTTPEDDPGEVTQDLSVRSPSDRIVVWQQNIEAMKGARAKPYLLTRAMTEHAYKPDLVVLAEAWQKVLCGDYTNDDAAGNPALTHWRGSRTDGSGLATTCAGGRDALPGSVLYRLGNRLWGAAKNAGHRRPYDDEQGSTGRTGTAVVWDETRFTFEDGFAYDDADVPGCGRQVADWKRTVVLLRDTRRTASTADDRLVAVAAVHYASACVAAANVWVAEQMMRRWGSRGLDLRILGGDFNERVDSSSSSYVDRRLESSEASWFRSTTRTWRDAAVAGRAGSVCAEWTYPNVAHCAGATSCSARCDGYGIGGNGQLMRIDYTFVSGREGPLWAGRVLKSETNDSSAGYSDHKATYTVISW